MRIAGVGGWVRVGYQTAATLGAWTLSYAGGSGAIESVAITRDTFWLSAPQVDVSLCLGPRQWIWRGATLQSRDPLHIQVQGTPEHQPL